ncbi:MAG TPA: hypothetical protein ENO27_02160 [Caldithrix sp.]|nr:hypothetical protein [Caldithrix sp.]
MRQSFFKLTILALAAVFLSLSAVLATESDNVNWDRFSEGLKMALKSDNLGVKLSAMQLVIKYGDKVDVTAARYDVMDSFLYSKDRRVRRLALVTLAKINNTFDMGLLERQIKFEDDPVIKNQIAAVLIAADRLTVPAKYAVTEKTVASNVTP